MVPARLRKVRPDTRAMAALVAIVLAANVPYLFRVTEPNPIGPLSQLSVDRAGPVAGADTLDPTVGYVKQALGHLAAEDILHGHLPWWNPYEGAGFPLAGEGQSSALFPPTLLLALDNGEFYEDILLELVAGLATFLVLRRIGARRVASVVGGAAFALNGAVAWLGTSSNPIAFLPLLVLGIEYAYSASAERRRGGWWLIAVALALSLYAGFPETAYIDGLIAGLWFLWRCGCGDRLALRRLLIKAACGVGSGLLLAAPFLIAFVGALPHEFVGFHSGGASKLTMPPYAVPQLLLPYVYGPVEAFTDPRGVLGAVWGYAGGFASVSLFFLGALSFTSRRQRGLKLVLAIWLVLAITQVYGEPPLIDHLLQLLPGSEAVAFYRYTFPAIEFAVVVLGALGLSQLADGFADRRAVAAVTVAMLALLGVLGLVAHHLVVSLDGGAGHSHWAQAQATWAVGVVVVIAACALWRRPMRLPRAWIVALVVIADAVLMFIVPELAAPSSVQIDRAPLTYVQQHVGTGRFFTLGPLAPNYGAYWGVASLNDLDLPLPSHWTSYVTSHLDNYVNPVFFVGDFGGGRPSTVPTPEHELLANLGSYRDAAVNYVLTTPGEALPQGPGSFRLVLRTPVAWIYRVAASVPFFTTSSPCAARFDGIERVRVTCSRPATLLRRELAFPGWSATLDGRAAPIRPADGIFQSVSIPAGTHTVSFSYAPPYIGWALVGMLVGAGWLMLGIVGRPARPRVARPRVGRLNDERRS